MLHTWTGEAVHQRPRYTHSSACSAVTPRTSLKSSGHRVTLASFFSSRPQSPLNAYNTLFHQHIIRHVRHFVKEHQGGRVENGNWATPQSRCDESLRVRATRGFSVSVTGDFHFQTKLSLYWHPSGLTHGPLSNDTNSSAHGRPGRLWRLWGITGTNM